MKKQLKAIVVVLTVAMLMVVTAFLPASLNAGNLEPTGPSGPIMEALDEIYNKLEVIDSKLVSCGECEEAAVPKTGQTEVYTAADDGDLEIGVTWPDPRFTDHEDGTVTDNLTGLMWTKDADKYGFRTWADSFSSCADCNDGAYSDWRLPNVRELQSLIDYGESFPALPPGHPFYNVQLLYYWSSTTYALNPEYAWLVNLYYGHVNYYDKSYDRSYVWCVRGGA